MEHWCQSYSRPLWGMEAPCKARLHGDGGTTLSACWEGTASRPWGACAPGSLPSAGLMTSPWGHPLPLLCFLAGDSHPHPLWGLIPTPPLDPDSGCSLSGVEAQLTRRKAWVKADCQASVKAPACLAQAFPVAKLISCSLRALFLKFLFIYLFIYWLHWVFIAVCAFSNCSKRGLLSCSVWASHCGDFSSFAAQVLGCPGLNSCGVWAVAPRHVGSSQTRDRTCVPCIGRWILIHWTTREVLHESS